MKKPTLWTRNFTLLILASSMGAVGGIASSFALSFLVFDETGSTLAAGFLAAVNTVPSFVIPLIAAPFLDRLPRKPFLVGGDAVNGVLYFLAGLFLLRHSFSYGIYLGFSLLISSLSAFDELAYDSIYPLLISERFTQKGYSVSSLVYPTLKVLITPIAAVLFDKVGVAWILVFQGILSVTAAITESRICLQEKRRQLGGKFSFRTWWGDLCEAWQYLRKEHGIGAIYAYCAVTNGAAGGYSSLIIAFFRTAQGFTTAMYSMFSVVEFIGRTLGGLLHYHVPIKPERRFSFAFLVYQIYDVMDTILLWLPYPVMLANRAACGFLGINSATLRQAAVQRYIPDSLRAKLNAFATVLNAATYGILSLAIGALGEVLDYRICMSFCGGLCLLVGWGTIWKQRRSVRKIYNFNLTEISAESSEL